jgi:hypothetical protein
MMQLLAVCYFLETRIKNDGTWLVPTVCISEHVHVTDQFL